MKKYQKPELRKVSLVMGGENPTVLSSCRTVGAMGGPDCYTDCGHPFAACSTLYGRCPEPCGENCHGGG